ncbi:hypothetical protein NGB36_32780, partial [Streptomyces sp. RB6PN25]
MNALLSAGSDVPREVMLWRVRLYCGHLAEVTRNVGAQWPTGYEERCPECGFDRATIVAYEPVGREVQPPRSTRTRRLSQERGRRAVIAVDDPVLPAASPTARQTAAGRRGRDEAPVGRDGTLVERPAALSGTRRRRGEAAQGGVLPEAWRVLAMRDDLPEAAQASIAEMLVAHGTPPQRAAFCAREDVADPARTGILRAVDASEATRLVRCVPRLNAELVLTVFQARGASVDLLLACAARFESDDLAVRIAGELRAAGAIEAARRWPRSRPLPPQVHSALIDAIINDVPPRTGCNGPDKEENDRNLKAQMAAEGEWEAQLWELIEHVPQWWGDLAARDGRAGRHVQLERMRALDHLSPRDAAKAWGVPPQGLRNAAEQISQIRSGSHRSLAKNRPGCPEPVTSFYGFPCKYPVEEGMDVCAMHRRAKAHPDTDSTSYALAAVQMHEGWEDLRARIWNLDKRALQSERLRLFRALETRATLSEEDYRLAALLMPSDDPATQERRALGLPGPDDGIGDGARLRGLGVLLAAAESAALGLNGGLPGQAGATGTPAEKKKSGPMLYSVTEAAERLGVGASWLRTESDQLAVRFAVLFPHLDERQ